MKAHPPRARRRCSCTMDSSKASQVWTLVVQTSDLQLPSTFSSQHTVACDGALLAILPCSPEPWCENVVGETQKQEIRAR